ncbi:hypothetical protein FFK22_039720 [Mycobacterium sp. KBS0706]|uniref:glycine-rich domain-containing protein n=1 Tax=Mycobacterium sp. KBS0706 TaxID=2578109 RepID=UPI00110F7659|nr:hypothetical protein [Mycobacterium sp. KBS0706]TSD83055.1 hypothetical protein FFK22_039720 [Mycobacterium sp. KBS0706]
MSRSISHANEVVPNMNVVGNTVLERLRKEDMGFVFERLVHSGEIEESEAPILEEEFKKFIYLVSVSEKPIAMIGPKPDEVWHQFILFTRQYEAFCEHTVGFFIDHTPDTDSARVPDDAGEEFLKAYTKHFGELPAIWTQGMAADTARAYAEWPAHGKPPVRWASVGSCAQVRRT